MPTIDISTPTLPTPTRRMIAVRLTRWLAARGARPAHVVVRFTEWPSRATFSGAMLVEDLPAADDDGLSHASVECRVGPERDEEFRADLADEIAAALGLTHDTRFLYIEFRPTSPADVFIAGRGALRRADQTARTPEEVT